MADAFYALEKLADALYALATGSGRVQERLGDAAIFLIRVRPEDISDENLRRIFIGVMDDLSYAQAQRGDEGNIRATMRLTDDEDARSIARRILELYHGSTASCESADPPGAVDLTYCCTGHGWPPTEGVMAP